LLFLLDEVARLAGELRQGALEDLLFLGGKTVPEGLVALLRGVD
jgi:hypothetical protein